MDFVMLDILKDFMKKTSMKKICFFFILISLFASPLSNEITRRNFLGKVTL
jgi:hypothetical protein